ncbi:predicted protein [Lichtheimia corymbifera JMRC:FSU:9682]|uniref:F-box domain-containing protein n=1 Tax=Lichtheimia corymbifera JMRC:FSU:9682 TaxID=1263082 RepID=A0A068SEK4_9FUNG|nr:predicted protein [Lichtheimia corymbifera JMRC:FSU:9682]
MLSPLDTVDSNCEQPNVLASTTATKKCVDFVRDLPWEIVKSYIVPRIFGEGRPVARLNQPYPYLDVSRTWTKRIVSAYGSIHFILGVGHPLSDNHRMRLRVVAPCIKSLSLTDLGAYNIHELFKCDQLLSLTKLNIEVTCSQEALLQLLETTPNLTHLDMTFYDNPQIPFAPFDILDRCPQVIRLNLMLYPNVVIDMTHNSELSRIYGNITHLQAVCQNEERRDIFVPLIQHFPNLRLLSLTHPPSSTSMSTIHQHCPKLQQLFLSDEHEPHEIQDDIKEEEDDIPGLRLLSIDARYYYGDYIPETMIRHHATLESLVLKKGIRLSIPHVETYLDRQDVEFKQLRSLTIPDVSQDSFMRFIDWVIQHAPNLQSIEGMDLTAHGHILSNTLRHRPFKRIGLHCTLQRQEDEYLFLYRHVRLGAQSSIEEIKCIIHCIDEYRPWIFFIPRLTQLKTLELCFVYDNPFFELDLFINAVSEGCIGLEKVIVKSTLLPSFSDWIRHLSKHRNLQEMIIDTTDIPDHYMIALLGFSHLKLLHLKYHIKNWDSLKRLKYGIPNLVYTDKLYP